MKKPEEIPLDESVALKPNKILFIKASSGFSAGSSVFDLTNIVKHNYDGMSAEYIYELHVFAKDLEARDAVFEIKQPKAFKRQKVVTDESQNEVATISAPIMAFGIRTFSFPQGSTHSTHDIEMKPVGMGRRAEGFVKDSVLYFWDKKENIAMLTKVIGDKRVEIAKFGAKHTYDKGGILALDTTQLDEIIVLITCVTLLNQLDSASGPLPHTKWAGWTWGGKMV